MKKLILTQLICIFVFMASPLQIFAQIPPNDPTWELVFSDDFDSTKVDSIEWASGYEGWNQRSFMLTCDYNQDNLPDTIRTGNVGYRTWNFENCVLDTTGNGVLKLISKHEPYNGKVWDSWVWDDCYNLGYNYWCPVETWVDFDYTTGMLMSRNHYRYGYFEIRCLLPEPTVSGGTKGVGPNFWLFGGNDTVSYSEIDIFEIAGEYDNNVNYHTCNNHFRKCNPDSVASCPDTTFYDNGAPRDPGSPNCESIGSIDFSSGYRTFGANWSNENIGYYLDGNQFYNVQNHSESMAPMQIIVDINHPAFNFCDTVVSPNFEFNYEYNVDYVKVWQLKMACDSSVTYCNFSNYRYKVYKDIALGGTGCTPTITNGSNVTVRANDFILLDKGFTVEAGAVFEADIVSCQNAVSSKSIGTEYPHLPPKGLIERLKY